MGQDPNGEQSHHFCFNQQDLSAILHASVLNGMCCALTPTTLLSDFWVMRSKALRLAAPQTRRQREFQRALQRMGRDAQNNANNQDDDNNDDHNDDNNDDDNNGNGNDNSGNGKQRGDQDEAARRKRALDAIHKEIALLEAQGNNDPAEHQRVQRLILQEAMQSEAYGIVYDNNHNHHNDDNNNDGGGVTNDHQDNVEAVDENDEMNNIVVYTEQQRQQYEAIAAALGFTTPRTLSQKTLLQRVIAWCERKK
eukprot:1721-Heterococcus_DN1.PRE.1